MIVMVLGARSGFSLSLGVAFSSTSDSWLGVAAPLSLDIHSSSSSPSSDGLEIVKPALCLVELPLVLDDAEGRRNVVELTSFCCSRTLLLFRDTCAEPRPFSYTRTVISVYQCSEST